MIVKSDSAATLVFNAFNDIPGFASFTPFVNEGIILVFSGEKHVANMVVYRDVDFQEFPREYLVDRHVFMNWKHAVPTSLVLVSSDNSELIVIKSAVIDAMCATQNWKTMSYMRHVLTEKQRSDVVEKNLPLYKHIYHHRHSDKIYAWFADGSSDEYSVKHVCYTDRKGEYGALPSGMNDIYGNPMYMIVTDDDGEKEIRDNHRGPENHISEADIDFRTRWLQRHYSGQAELKFDIKDYNIGILDIEVAGGDRFSPPEEAAYPVNAVTLYQSKLNKFDVFGWQRDISPESLARIRSLNEYLFDVDTILPEGVDARKLLMAMRCHPVVKLFDLPKGDEIGNSDVVRILNGILNSCESRDKFLMASVTATMSVELGDKMKRYLNAIVDYDHQYDVKRAEILSIKKSLNTLSVAKKEIARETLRAKQYEFKKWSLDRAKALKGDRLQKKIIRHILENTLPVTVGTYPVSPDATYRKFSDEADLLNALFHTIQRGQIDFLSGWNCSGYDFPYLFNRASRLGVDPAIMARAGNINKSLRQARISEDKKSFKSIEYYSTTIVGTTVWDYMMLHRMFSRSERDNNKLDTIGREEVGEEKLPLSNGYKTYKTNWDEWIEYNVQDVNLLVNIDRKMKLIETSIGVCSQARIPFDGIWESKKLIVGFLINYLHDRNTVFPPLREHKSETFPGAFVFSKPGLKKNLVSYDYRSMYPSIAMSCDISIEQMVQFPDRDITDEEFAELVISPVDGVFFKKETAGIVPSVMKLLFDGRTVLKDEMKKAIREARFADAEYLDMKQNSYKLYGNTLYGMLGLKYFQFYNLKCAHSVTAFGVDLIKYTITQISDYFDGAMATDERFAKSFGAYPTLDPEMKGYSRFSHGDTDSFFIIYDDIFAPYEALKGKGVDVVTIRGKEVVSRVTYATQEEAELRFQETIAAEVPDEWNALSESKHDEYAFQGVYTSKKADLMIVLDRHLLTDFCRILDRTIMQELLDNIMDAFAKKWHAVTDHKFYLKREKCILGALVSAKKKYLCLVESNEDILYPTPKEAVTGLEIVRSSTPPFARSRLKKLVSSMVRGASKQDVKDMIFQYKKEFFEYVENFNIYDISMPSGTKKVPMDIEAALSTKGTYFTTKSASIWNDLVANDPIMSKEGLEPVFAGSKVKQLAVKENNKYGTKYVVYNASECPERLLEIFEVDWDKQWANCFYNAAGRFTEVCGWGKDILANDSDDMIGFG